MAQALQTFVVMLTLLLAGSVHAQNQEPAQDYTPPCLHPELEHIAFLEGNWDVLSRQRVNFTEDRWHESRAQATWTPVLGISLAIFMLLPWPVSHVLRGKALPERPSGIPYRGEGMVLIAIAVFFASVAARVVGLPKRSNEAEMAVFHLVGAMVLP